MLRASISQLLLTLLGGLVATLLGSTLYIAWQAKAHHAHAGLVQRLADADRTLFRAVVDVRSQVPRSQTALVSRDDPGPAIAQAREDADARVADALRILDGVELAGRDRLVPDILARRDAVAAARGALDDQQRRPRPERDVSATGPWRQAVFALADALADASVAVGNGVRLEDPVIGELVEIRWNAWRIRDSYGFQCSALRPNIERGQPPDDRTKAAWLLKRGVTAASWQMLDDLMAHPGVAGGPAALVGAARAATDAAQAKIDAVVAGLDGSDRPAMPATEWTALCNGPFDAILAVGFAALDEATAHAERAQARASVQLAVCVGVLALTLLFGVVITLTVRRRLALPIAAMAAAMRGLAHGRLDVAVPCADRDDELGAIGKAMSAVIGVLDILRAEMHRLSGQDGGDATDAATVPTALDGTFADMAALMRSTRMAFREIGLQATHVAVAAGQAKEAVAQVSMGAGAQTADLEAVAVSVGETVRAITHVSDSVQDASDLVRAAAAFAGRGKEDMTRLLAMSQTIGDNARRVRQITDAIGDIAEMTNILSLNAAIEAARAGAQGRGFAVVAEEVGKLAENAASSARRVREIVDIAATLAEEGREVTEATWRMMDDLAGRVAHLEEMVQSIAAAMEQQRVTIAAIDGNVGNVRMVAQANAVASEQISATMQQLARIADDTRAQVARFGAC